MNRLSRYIDYGYVHVFFSKNGQQLAKPIKPMRSINDLYPLVGMHNPREKFVILATAGECQILLSLALLSHHCNDPMVYYFWMMGSHWSTVEMN